MTAADRYAIVRTHQQKENHMSMFSQPAAPTSGDNFSNAAHLGALLLIEPTEYVTDMETSAGTANAIRAAVANVDTGDTFPDALLFGKILVNQLRTQVGAKVLGRLAQGAKQPGKHAPWILEPATPGDVAKAEAYVASLSNGPSFATPAAAVAPF